MKILFLVLFMVGCSALDGLEMPSCNGVGMDTCPDGICVAGRCTTKCEIDDDCDFCCKETENEVLACAPKEECK
jgi:hypothetical protein